jgi:magnesium chelatase subunit I
VGSGNPEEGELRPQLLDRFGLSVEVTTPQDLKTRMQVVRLRDEFERDPAAFIEKHKRKDGKIRKQIEHAKEKLPDIEVPDATLEHASQLCMKLGTDGLRGELTLIRAARAYAALEGDMVVEDKHLMRVAPPALRHRLRRNVLDDAGSTTRVNRAVQELFGA